MQIFEARANRRAAAALRLLATVRTALRARFLLTPWPIRLAGKQQNFSGFQRFRGYSQIAGAGLRRCYAHQGFLAVGKDCSVSTMPIAY